MPTITAIAFRPDSNGNMIEVETDQLEVWLLECLIAHIDRQIHAMNNRAADAALASQAHVAALNDKAARAKITLERHQHLFVSQ